MKPSKTSRASSAAAPGLRRRAAAGKLQGSATTGAVSKARTPASTGKHVLRLYVAGATDRSRQAILRARRLCKAGRKACYELEVVDVYQQPILACDGQIVATPTLVRDFPRPVRRLIGNLSNATGLFVGLELDTKGRHKR